MVLDPIPQSLPVHFFGSRPQPPTSPRGCHSTGSNKQDNQCRYAFISLWHMNANVNAPARKLPTLPINECHESKHWCVLQCVLQLTYALAILRTPSHPFICDPWMFLAPQRERKQVYSCMHCSWWDVGPRLQTSASKCQESLAKECHKYASLLQNNATKCASFPESDRRIQKL